MKKIGQKYGEDKMKKIYMVVPLLLVILITACNPSLETTEAAQQEVQQEAQTVDEESTETSGEEANKDPIVIGSAGSLSGWFEPWDGTNTKMLELAIEDINEDGGLLGREVNLVTADQKSENKLSGQVGMEVINQGADIVMVACDFDMGSAAAIAANDKGLVALSSCAAGTKFNSIGPLSFSLGTGTPVQGTAIAEWAYNVKGWDKAYLLLDDFGDYNRKVAYYFETRFKELAGDDAIIGNDVFINSDPSVASQVTKLKAVADDADFIMLSSFPPGGASALRQIRAAGIDLPVISAEAFDGDYWLETVPDLNDFYFVTYASIFGDDPDQKVNEILDRYEAKYGERPQKSNCLTGYSVGEAIAKAVTESGSLEGSLVAAELEKFDQEPLMAGPTTFTKEMHMDLYRSMRLIEITNGKPSFVEIITPEKVPAIVE